MKKCFLLFAFICLVNYIVVAKQNRMVFAHYMVCFASYDNGTVDGYKKDIQDAQRMGIDGFALNCGSWDANYKMHVVNLFKAAQELNSGFKLFFSVDRCCGITNDQIEDMVETYGDSPVYYKYNNRPFVSAWAAGTSFKVIIPALKQKGFNIYFVPFLYALNFGKHAVEIPDYDLIVDNYNEYWKNYIDGYFYFGAVGLPIKDIRLSNIDVAESFAKVLHSNGLTYMSFVSPEYWGDRQYGARRYYEYNGGEGIIAQWESIISDQLPEWVELTTWNDWTEGSYFSPIDNIEDYVVPLKQLHPEKGFYKSHKGYGELSKYYIQWYKTGSKPAIHKDEIFYFYRTQSKDAITNDPVGRVAGRAGDVEDVVYITSFLTAPAQLIVKSGNVTQNFNLQKGINNTRVPFQPGKQYFKVLRNNKIVINQQGQDIESSPASYNFNVYSGYAISEK